MRNNQRYQVSLSIIFLVVLLSNPIFTEGQTVAQQFSAQGKSISRRQSSTGVQQSPPAQSVEDEIVVKFRSGVSKNNRNAKIMASGSNEVNGVYLENAVLLKVPHGQAKKQIDTFKQMADVEYAEPNYIGQISDTIPQDPYVINNDANLANVQAYSAWDITTGSTNVIIAIIDTGVDYNNAEFAGKIAPGYDFVNNDADPMDDNGHGTHVAGITAAIGNNSTAIAGMSWNSQIMPLKVLSAAGKGTTTWIASGINWAADHGARVINLSLGYSYDAQIVRDAITHAISHDVVVVAAAGNSGDTTNTLYYPAAYDSVIAVAAVDETMQRAYFSNYGPTIDVAAPGWMIYSTVPTGVCELCNPSGLNYSSGTSMAAPFVTGLAALLASQPQFDTVAKIRSAIESSALDLGDPGKDIYYGHGLIQAYSALMVDPNVPTNTPTITSTPTATFTRTPTASNTSTPTKTNTPTVTNTASPTATFPNSPTPTNTSTPTATRTATATHTPTVTKTATPTATKTATSTVTETATPTATETATPTATETETSTATETATETATATATETATATVAPTATTTPTVTKTAVPSLTPTRTNTSTKTPTPTRAVTGQVITISPISGTYTNSYNPYMTWQLATNATYYQIIIDKDPLFASPDYKVTTLPNAHGASSPFLPEGKYFWKVRAFGISGFGPYSTAKYFIVDRLPPSPVALLNPPTASQVPLGSRFSWSASLGAASYQFQVDDIPNFSSPNVSTWVNGTIFSPASLPKKTLYWRVRARDLAGNLGAWSPVFTVTIK